MVSKLDRVNRHFDHVIDVNVVMSVENWRQRLRRMCMSGREIHAASEGETSTPPLMSWPTGWTVRCCATRRPGHRDEGFWSASALTSTERFHPATAHAAVFDALHQNRRISSLASGKPRWSALRHVHPAALAGWAFRISLPVSRLADLLTPENVLLDLDVANKRRLFEIIALESELRYDLTPR